MKLERKKSAIFGVGPAGKEKDPLKKADKGNCVHFTNLGFDSICFHRTCRQAHTQVLCSFCDSELQLHRSHPQEQFPIHKASPGFRLLDYSSFQESARISTIDPQELNKAIATFMTEVRVSVEQIVGRSMQRLQCFSDFLGMDASFKVCDKIRNTYNQHQACCLPIINDLKDLEEKGRASENSVQEIILLKAEREKSYVNRQIGLMRVEMQKVFEKFGQDRFQTLLGNPKTSKERSSLIQKQVQQISKNIWQRQQRKGKSLIHSKPIKNKSEDSEKRDSPIYKLVTRQQPNSTFSQNCSQSRLKGKNKGKSTLISHNLSKSMEDKGTKKIGQFRSAFIPNDQRKIKRLKGIQLVNADTIRIRKTNKRHNFLKIINYLSTLTQVKNLIIESQVFVSSKTIDLILRHINWVQGIHIHCSFNRPLFLKTYPIKDFSLFPTYQHLRVIDKERYFESFQVSVHQKNMQQNMKLLQEKSFLNKIYIYKNNCPKITSNIEELQFVSLQSRQTKLQLANKIFLIDISNCLFILSFTNVVFKANATFKQVFMNCTRLHTLVFRNSEGNYNKIVKQFTYLKPFQLKQLQISCDELEKMIVLQPCSIAEIFRLRSLQTLILTNIEFVDPRHKEQTNSSILKDITNLRELIHLNLYSSFPVYSDILSYISKQCYSKMEMINLGCSEIQHGISKYLQKFTNLKYLCLDYTSIGDQQLLLITKDMKQLTYLSIQNLNGELIVYEQQEYSDCHNHYGKVTPYFLENMHYKTLRCVNIYNCHQLKDYQWELFKDLEFININKEIIHPKLLNLFRRRGVCLAKQFYSGNNSQQQQKEQQRTSNRSLS